MLFRPREVALNICTVLVRSHNHISAQIFPASQTRGRGYILDVPGTRRDPLLSDMSTAELSARVSDLVASVCFAYQEGFVLIQNIRAKNKQLPPLAQQLETSLTRGETAVNGQYEKSRIRFGEIFALGDRTSLNSASASALSKLLTLCRISSRSLARHHWPSPRASHIDLERPLAPRRLRRLP